MAHRITIEVSDETLALVTEWQTAYQSLSEIRHKLLQERDDWKSRALLASENVDELRAENAKLREENTYLAADGRHWREMFHKKQQEFLRWRGKFGV